MADQKLWTVNVSVDFEMAIVAATKEEALRHAKRNVSDELTYVELDYFAEERAPSPDLNDAIPYGDHHGDETVAAWKKKLGVQRPLEARMSKLAEALRAKAAEGTK